MTFRKHDGDTSTQSSPTKKMEAVMTNKHMTKYVLVIVGVLLAMSVACSTFLVAPDEPSEELTPTSTTVPAITEELVPQSASASEPVFEPAPNWRLQEPIYGSVIPNGVILRKKDGVLLAGEEYDRHELVVEEHREWLIREILRCSHDRRHERHIAPTYYTNRRQRLGEWSLASLDSQYQSECPFPVDDYRAPIELHTSCFEAYWERLIRKENQAEGDGELWRAGQIAVMRNEYVSRCKGNLSP